MKTKGARKPKTNAETFTVGPEPASDPAPAVETSTNAGDRKERVAISFDLNSDGSPDFSSMREKTRERVKQFFSDPKIAEEFGAKPPAPQVEVQIFHPAMISGMYDLIGSVEAMVFGRAFKLPEAQAKKIFSYTDLEKRALEGPTCRVLNKYAADWMIRYQDEIALATLLISVTIAKCNAASMIAKMNASPGAGPQPVNTPKNDENDEKRAVDTTGPVQ